MKVTLTDALIKRHRSAATRELERADRGEVVGTADAPDAERVEITGAITRIDPARR